MQLCEAKSSVADEKSGNTSELVIIHSKLEYMHGPGHDTRRAAENITLNKPISIFLPGLSDWKSSKRVSIRCTIWDVEIGLTVSHRNKVLIRIGWL